MAEPEPTTQELRAVQQDREATERQAASESTRDAEERAADKACAARSAAVDLHLAGTDLAVERAAHAETTARLAELEEPNASEVERLRDRFAMFALNAVEMYEPGESSKYRNADRVAQDCYDVADAMMFERERRETDAGEHRVERAQEGRNAE